MRDLLPGPLVLVFESLKVSVAPGKSRVGEPVTISWSIAEFRKDISRPRYLIFALPNLVRLDGSGFYGLLSQSPGPYNAKYGAGRVRAVAPLHTQFGKTSGQIEVLPYAAGPLDIEWAVVGIDGCGERRAGWGRADPILISAGAPRITLRDQYGDIKPTRVIRLTVRTSKSSSTRILSGHRGRERRIRPEKGGHRADVFADRTLLDC